MLREVLSTAPIATEIPQVRSALTGVLTAYNGTLHSRPGIVEYGDVQKNDDGTLNGILKRCYAFIDKDKTWHRMTGYKVGNLVSQWYGQAQFAPQVMGYLEGPPPVPAENFPIGSDSDVRTYAYSLNNSISFNQAEEVAYNYSTSKEAGWNVAVESEGTAGVDIDTLIAPFGFGISIKGSATFVAETNWETSGNRAQSFERGISVNTDRSLSAALAGYDNGRSRPDRYYTLGSTGYALVKSKTADIYLLRLAHNNALVSISWQPNPDIPEDVNIIPFPINPLYTKQGTLDGKFGEATDDHYPQAHGAYGQYSYFKPREAYQLKKQIERETMELKAYFEDSFDVARTNAHFDAAAATTGIAQLSAFIPGFQSYTSIFNQVAGQLATQVAYNNSELKDDLARIGSQRNLANTYVWTVEGGFYAESTEVAETQQETYSNDTTLSLGGGLGVGLKIKGGGSFEQKTLFSSGSSFTLTKSKTRESSTSFGLDVNVDIPTSPRSQYGGVDGRTLTSGLIQPGTVDAYRFMSFYLEPKGQNFTDLFTKVVDPIWLDESPDPNAQALRQARGNIDRAKPCWRIMHRVTYVSRVLPEFQPEAPPSLEQTMRVSGIESNYMLIKQFEPYLANITDSGTFFQKIEEIIDAKLPEFTAYKQQIKYYLALYFNIDQA
jgi:carbon monoxide dehydrogenase subunit G